MVFYCVFLFVCYFMLEFPCVVSGCDICLILLLFDFVYFLVVCFIVTCVCWCLFGCVCVCVLCCLLFGVCVVLVLIVSGWYRFLIGFSCFVYVADCFGLFYVSRDLLCVLRLWWFTVYVLYLCLCFMIFFPDFVGIISLFNLWLLMMWLCACWYFRWFSIVGWCLL